MENIEDFIRKKNINIDELCEYLDISKPTYYTWVREKKPENLRKIAQAIEKMADDLKIGISSITQGSGSMAAGSMTKPKIFQGNDIYTKEYIELLKEKCAYLEQKVKDLQEEIKQLKNK